VLSSGAVTAFPPKFALCLLAAVAWGCAFSAGASAEQTVICEQNLERRCAPAQTAHEAYFGGSAKFTFKGSGSTTCSATVMEFMEDTANFSFGVCSEGCKVSTQNAPYEAALDTAAEPFEEVVEEVEYYADGDVDLRNGGSGSPAFKTICGSAECVYGATEIPGSFAAGQPASVTIYSELEKKSGNTIFCPSSATVEGTFQSTSPEAGYLKLKSVFPPEGNRLCGVLEEECPLEFSRGLDFEAKLKPETKAKFVFSLEITCSGGAIVAESEESEGTALEGAAIAKHTSCAPCSPGPVLTASPLHAELVAGEGGNGELKLSNGGSGKPTITTSCFDCVYSAESVNLDFVGGEPATVVASGESLAKQSGGFGCGSETLKWSGTYEVTEPESPLYVSSG
jgi:hypothetical protein